LERQRATAVQAGAVGVAEIDRQYQYDTAGRLVLALDPRGQLTYAYDAVDRLMRLREERFAFDPAHNMVPPNQPETIVRDNRVLNVDGRSYRYDAHGRVAEKRADGTVVRFTWNNDHRLVASTTTDAAGSYDTYYLYDAFGRRIAKRGPHATIWFVWDFDRLLQEYRGDHEYTYIYEPEAFAPLAEAVLKRNGTESTERGLLYFHCDQVGVPRELTDPAGHLIWEAEYHGWGRLKTESLTHLDVPRPLLRLQGEYCDDETGLHYSFMRYYDPDIGRFVSKDPVGLFGGVNEYWYGPNPIFWVDYLGLTGTYIFTDGKTSYVGKGPKERKEASQRARVKGKCNVTAEASADFGDSEMGFMVEHLLMEHFHAQTDPNFANSPNLNSPGKKKLEAASPGKKRSAKAKAKKLIEEFEAAKAACEE
jgi:RHS repeat-associated protein